MTTDEKIAALERAVAALAGSNVATANAMTVLNSALDSTVKVNSDLLALIKGSHQAQATMMVATALILNEARHVPVRAFIDSLKIAYDAVPVDGASKTFLKHTLDALRVADDTGQPPKLSVIDGGLSDLDTTNSDQPV